MSRIKGVKRLTDNRFLNLYELDARQRNGEAIRYYVSSRARSTEDLKAVSGQRRADGVIMYGVYGENRDRLVLIRQYRYPLGDYIYEFPAGLVEPGEDVREAGIREMFEETGLRFRGLSGGPCLNLYTLDGVRESLEKLIGEGHEYIGVATHEQYFYEDYYVYQPEYADKIYLAAKMLSDAGYRFVTCDELK